MGRVATGRASGVKPSQMFSKRVVSDFLLDQSRPGITTIVTSDWVPSAMANMLLGCEEEVESNGEERRRGMKRGSKLRRSS